MKTKRLFLLILLASIMVVQSGCALFVGAAAGGTGAYILRDKGYTVQNPIKKGKKTNSVAQEY